MLQCWSCRRSCLIARDRASAWRDGKEMAGGCKHGAQTPVERERKRGMMEEGERDNEERKEQRRRKKNKQGNNVGREQERG